MTAVALVALLSVAALAARSAWRARVAPELARLERDVQQLAARVEDLERSGRRAAPRVPEALAARVSDDAQAGEPAPQPARVPRTVH